MNGMAILLAAIGGGLGGALGALAAARFAKGYPGASRALILVGVLVLADVGAQMANAQWFLDRVHPPTRAELVMRPYVKEIETDSAIKAKVGTDPAQSEKLGRDLAHLGLKRLPAADLDRWNELRLLLSAESKPLCAGFWSGNFDALEVNRAIGALSDPALSDWYRISFEAMRLEAHSAVAPPVAADAITAGLAEVRKRLAEPDRSRFDKAVMQGQALSSDEGCWTVTTLMRGAKSLDNKARESLLRGLAAI